MVRMTCNVGTGTRERLISALDSLCEMTQDFTDSAYTPHHHREQILDFLEECRFEMTNLIQPDVSEFVITCQKDIICQNVLLKFHLPNLCSIAFFSDVVD